MMSRFTHHQVVSGWQLVVGITYAATLSTIYHLLPAKRPEGV